MQLTGITNEKMMKALNVVVESAAAFDVFVETIQPHITKEDEQKEIAEIQVSLIEKAFLLESFLILRGEDCNMGEALEKARSEIRNKIKTLRWGKENGL